MPLEHWFYTVPLRLRSLFRRRRVEQELDEEIQDHLERKIQDNIALGMPSDEARYAALRDMDGLAQRKEECRDARRLNLIDNLFQDLRYGARMLRRSPGFTTAAVLSLGLGIGANTAIFSVIDALMLRSLPVRNPEQLVTFVRSLPGRGSSDTIAYPMFEKFRDLRQMFSGVSAVFQIGRSNVTVNGPGGGLDSGSAVVGLVSGNYFSMLGVTAAIGRTFTAGDDRIPGGHPVAVISHRYWQRWFDRDPAAVGRTFTLGNTTYSILGVAAAGFSGEVVGQPTDLWIPMAMQSQLMPERPGLLGNPVSMWTRIIARLEPGMTIKQAQPFLQLTFHQLLREAAGSNPSAQSFQRIAQQRFDLLPVATGFAVQREFFAQPLKILMIVVGLVLLIACANVANLLLARSAARQREMAVRLSIGAGRLRVLQQLLTESVLLATMGGLLGLLFARVGTNALMKLAASGRARMSLDIHTDARILAFTAALCLLTGILFGLAPASRGTQVSLTPALNGRGADSRGAGGWFGLGKVLVISQVALSLVLLISAGLFVRTLSNLRSQELGFDRQHVLLIWTAPGNSNRQGAALAKLYESAQERISALPGVISASPSRNGLLSGFVGIRQVAVEGYSPQSGEDMGAQWSLVSPRFFDTVGMRLLVGRDFTRRYTETAPRVAIVNETMARDFFQGRNPLGKRFGMGRDETYPVEIVGVVQDSKYFSLREKNQRMIYLPYRQDLAQLTEMCLAVRTAGDPAALVAAIRRELGSIDRSLQVPKIDTIAEQIDQTLVEDRLVASLAGFFGVLAVLLACLGLYGVMSYTTARRMNEIGIRLALGATRSGLLGMVLRDGLALVIIGIAIGVPVTLGLTRLVQNMLFGVRASDPFTIGGAILLMIAVAALAGLLPARRAARVAPMIALRYE